MRGPACPAADRGPGRMGLPFVAEESSARPPRGRHSSPALVWGADSRALSASGRYASCVRGGAAVRTGGNRPERMHPAKRLCRSRDRGSFARDGFRREFPQHTSFHIEARVAGGNLARRGSPTRWIYSVIRQRAPRRTVLRLPLHAHELLPDPRTKSYWHSFFEPRHVDSNRSRSGVGEAPGEPTRVDPLRHRLARAVLAHRT